MIFPTVGGFVLRGDILKKKVYKIAVAVFVLILMCCTLCIPVSAEDLMQGVKTEFLMNQLPRLEDFVFTSGTSSTSPINYLDLYAWDRFSPSVSATAGEYDYSYYSFVFEENLNKANSVVSYAIYDIHTPDLSSYTGTYSVRLNSGFFQFFASSSLAVTDIRFSLRSFNPSNSAIGYVEYISDTFELTSSASSPDINSYDVQIDSITFYRSGPTASIPFGGMPLCLCIDFIFTPLVIVNSFTFGIDDSSVFNLWQFPTGIGPDFSPYYPELSNPLYKNPDTSTMDAMSVIQDYIYGELSSMDITPEDLYSDLKLNIGDFKDGLLSVGTLLTQGVSKLPFIEFVFIFSLSFGLLSFLLGLGHSIIGAAQSQVKASRRAVQREAQRASRSKTGSSSNSHKSK